MIISVAEAKNYIATALDDSVLEARLQALELQVRGYTNNNFQMRNIRFKCPVMATKLYLETNMLSVGDTVQISDSLYSDGVYTITAISDGFIELNKNLLDESAVLVTKVEYPMDVKMGVVNMLKYDLEGRDKQGIQSETISRHSVTYFDSSSTKMLMGYPESIMGFLASYRKARF